MLSKKEIKDIQSLSHKKFRKALKLFVAEGPKIVGELIEQVPGQVEKIYATESWLRHAGYAERFPVVSVSEAELGKISSLQTPNQVLAVFRQFHTARPNENEFSLYLDTIQDPGNFGTIIRIADWFGVKQVVCNQGCADVYNPKVIQASMASIARVQMYYDEDGSWISRQTLPVYAATLHGRPLHEYSKTNKAVLIIGNESRGISEELMQLATEKITIPRKGQAESLNAAVATGILLSHLLS